MDNFEVKLVGAGKFPGYVSAFDKTLVPAGTLIKGSQNVYKTKRGTIAPRFGLKYRGSGNATDAGTVASYVWRNSVGSTFPLRVNNNRLQIESNIADGSTLVWYDLKETGTLNSPALTYTRFNFDSWWDDTEKKDRLLMCRGDDNLLHWSGGVALVSGITTTTDAIIGVDIGSAGSGYVVGDIVTVVQGSGTGGTARILSVSGGIVTGLEIASPGSGYTTATSVTTSGGSGTNFRINITAGTSYGLTKQGTTTWAQAGFASNTSTLGFRAQRKVIVNGIELNYLGGQDTTTLTGILTDISSLTSGMVAIQSVQISATTPIASYKLDFLRVVGNQVLTGSYSSRALYLSADTDFSNFTNTSDLVYGDPDVAVIDNPPTGMAVKAGTAYVSAGDADWYLITPNSTPPVAIPIGNSHFQYVILKVEKKVGAGGTAAYAHEFIDTLGDDIVYLAKDQQVRIFGSFRNLDKPKYPTISQAIFRELQNEDFTGGQLKCIGDFIHITAPNNGRDWLHETRETINVNGVITAERLWHAPHIRGISRFESINGIAYGHSNSHPEFFQIWDTNQWHDDHNSGESVPYTSIMVIGYQNHGRRQGLLSYDRIYVEGYMTPTVTLNGFCLNDYLGSTSQPVFVVNSVASPAKTFSSTLPAVLGSSGLGTNPLGSGLILDPDEQELLPKFRTMVGVNRVNVFEYAIGLYSDEADSRWEVLALGTNVTKSTTQQATFIKKSG